MRRMLTLCTATMLAVVLCGTPAWAQTAKKRAGGRKKPAAAPVARPALPGQQACEGALEIVPRTELSFTRKRYPAPRTDAAPPSTGVKQN